mgnify:CR=1 FL=1
MESLNCNNKSPIPKQWHDSGWLFYFFYLDFLLWRDVATTADINTATTAKAATPQTMAIIVLFLPLDLRVLVPVVIATFDSELDTWDKKICSDEN